MVPLESLPKLLEHLHTFLSSEASFTPGGILVLYHLQNIIHPPFKIQNVSKPSPVAVLNPVHSDNRVVSISKTILLAYLLFLISYLISRLTWLTCGSHPTEITNLVEQCLVNIILLCLMLIALGTHHLLATTKSEMCYLISQRFQQLPIPVPSPRPFTKGDLFVFGFASCFLSFPICVFAGPFAINYDPWQILVSPWLKPNFLAKLAFAVSYGILDFYFASTVLLTMLYAVVVLEGLQHLSQRLCNTIAWQNSKRKMIDFRIMQILIRVCNSETEKPLMVLVFCGILIASGCGYATLKMADKFPPLVYAACPLLVVVIMFANFVMMAMADIPFRCGEKFRTLWVKNGKVGGDMERRWIKSCPSIGYCIGPMKNVGKYASLLISDRIVDLTVNFVLMN